MSFEEALDVASRDERFTATVYAMNTLLIDKGVYTRAEFEGLFVEWVTRDPKKSGNARHSTASSLEVRL